MIHKKWTAQLTARFSDREHIPQRDVYRLHWSQLGCSEAEVREVLQFIEDEFGVPGGLLRPQDSIEKLTEPVSTKNPLLWYFFRVFSDDSTSELNWQLKKRLKGQGLNKSSAEVRTLEDYVRTWCAGSEISSVR